MFIHWSVSEYALGPSRPGSNLCSCCCKLYMPPCEHHDQPSNPASLRSGLLSIAACSCCGALILGKGSWIQQSEDRSNDSSAHPSQSSCKPGSSSCTSKIDPQKRDTNPHGTLLDSQHTCRWCAGAHQTEMGPHMLCWRCERDGPPVYMTCPFTTRSLTHTHNQVIKHKFKNSSPPGTRPGSPALQRSCG